MSVRVSLRGGCAAFVLATALAAAPAPAGAAVSCATPIAYPGDVAPATSIAKWMANGARARVVPGELPVMGALVESGLKNLNYGDADAVGFFQMRTGIWDRGDYAGFPDQPELQLRWFLDQAIATRDARRATGDSAYGVDPSRWGEWAADVLRPAAQYRGRYQLRLTEARNLIGPECWGLAPLAMAPPPDMTAPAAILAGPRSQKAGRTIVVTIACGAEACSAAVSGTVSVPGASKVFRLRSAKKQLAAGARAKLRLGVPARARRAIKRALGRRRKVVAKLKLRVTDAAGNASTGRRSVKLRR